MPQVDWLPFTVGFVVAVGIEGILIKLALRDLRWTAIFFWTTVSYPVPLFALWVLGDLEFQFPAFASAQAAVAGVCASIGLILLNLALSRGDALLVIPFTSAYPVVTVILAIPLLGERLTQVRALGLASVVVGLMLLGRAE